MDPIDYRNITWKEIQDRLSGLRHRCWLAWLNHGPGTTREVAYCAGIDLLTFRPRTTELYQLGFLQIAEEKDGHEGVYRARTMTEASDHYFRMAQAARNPQLDLTF